MITVAEKLVDLKEKITTHGRVYFENGGLMLGWSACGFTLKFCGTAVAVSFLPYSTNDEETKTVAVKLEIDGVGRKAIISDGGELVFADGLEDSLHTLRFLKVSESHEPLFVSGIEITGERPKILTYKKNYALNLEVIGDSITCGYGIMGARPSFASYEEDATLTYAWQLGERLNADTRLVSWSGRGLVRDCSGLAENRFSEFHGYKVRNGLYGEFESDGWCADLVVVNGGTNDQNSSVAVSDEEFYVAAKAFYERLRVLYPKAKIVFFFGAMGTRYDGVYRSVIDEISGTDSAVFYLPTESITEEKGEVGANGHPNVKANVRFAEELYDFINKKVNIKK